MSDAVVAAAAGQSKQRASRFPDSEGGLVQQWVGPPTRVLTYGNSKNKHGMFLIHAQQHLGMCPLLIPLSIGFEL